MNKAKPPYFRVTQRVTLITALTNSLLAIGKISVGSIAYSHALIADGLHSLSDLFGDGLVYLAAKLGSQSPDDDHPYGHRRIETLGAIVVALILLLVGFWLVFDAIGQIHHPHIAAMDNSSVLVAAILSIFINEGLYQYGAYYGKQINSQLLISNAWHNRSDAFTSLIVVLTVLGSLAHIPHLDLIGAIIIGLMIFYTGSKMMWRCFRELIDTGADEATLTQIQKVIATVPGVDSVHQLRTRLLGGEIFIDVHIQVAPNISVSEGHYIGEHVHLELIKQVEHVSDVIVHIDPEDDTTHHPCVNLANRPQLLSALQKYWQDLPEYTQIKRIQIHYHDGHLDLEVHCQTAFDLALRQRYQQALQDNPQHIRQVTFYHIL
jgi:cation diffusion facilitator family transporter